MHLEDATVASGNQPARENSDGGQRQSPKASSFPHWVFLTLAVAVLCLSFTLSMQGERHVYIPGTRTALPGLCVFRSTVGIDCPGCGLTRCFISLAHGDLMRAWQFNPAGFLFFAFVAVQVPFQLAQILRIRTGRDILRSRYFNWIIVVVAVCLILQWAVKMSLLVLA